MSLSQKSRVALYQGLSGLIPDEDAVEEFLSQFPSRDLDEPVTKDYHRAETALLRGEFHADMAELRSEMADLSSELRSEMADLRTSSAARWPTSAANSAARWPTSAPDCGSRCIGVHSD